MSVKFRILAVATVCLGFASAAQAQQKYEHRTCYTGPHHMITNSKDAMGGTYQVTAMVMADPGDPLYMATGVCMGSWTLVGGQYNDAGSCEYVLPSGDRLFGLFSRKNQENGLWKVVSATGKMEGVVHGGNWAPFTSFPQTNGQLTLCGREWGTWKPGPN